ncbi:Uncharacterized protein DAT39_017117 [Clarias magur]|uniref:Uncharacterized protein n=1 Tax=Clarias magur TaxID=1594786 RepID=A0A8J4TD86_CLAMG|nr:Uncharacterized protein DAT39_017117 [Clarias magur]
MHFQMALEAAQLTDALPTVQAAVKLFSNLSAFMVYFQQSKLESTLPTENPLTCLRLGQVLNSGLLCFSGIKGDLRMSQSDSTEQQPAAPEQELMCGCGNGSPEGPALIPDYSMHFALITPIWSTVCPCVLCSSLYFRRLDLELREQSRMHEITAKIRCCFI